MRIKRLITVITVLFIVLLAVSLTMQLLDNKALSVEQVSPLNQSEVELGDVVQYQVSLKTNWFNTPRAEVIIAPSGEDFSLDLGEVKLKSINFSSLTWIFAPRLTVIDTEDVLKEVVAKFSMKPIFERKKVRLDAPLPIFTVKKLDDQVTSEVRYEELIDETEQLKQEQANQRWWWLVLIITPLVALIIWLVTRKKKEKEITPCWIIALDMLSELKSKLPLPAEQFFVESTDVVRVYIEALYELPATETTTPEFIRALKNHQALDVSAKATLSDFMNQADMIKFAKQTSSSKQMDEALLSLINLVENSSAEYQRKQEQNNA